MLGGMAGKDFVFLSLFVVNWHVPDGADGGHQEVTHFMDTWSNVIPRGSVVIQEDALQGRS